MNAAVAVLEAAERYWLIGVILILTGALVLAAIAEAIEHWRGPRQ